MNAHRIIHLLLFLSSFIVYFEWGTESHTFLIQGEMDVLKKLFTEPSQALHPFTVLPLIGQVLLLIAAFQKRPSRWLTYLGIAGLALLVVMVLFISIIGLNGPMLISTIPFLTFSVLAIRVVRKPKSPMANERLPDR